MATMTRAEKRWKKRLKARSMYLLTCRFAKVMPLGMSELKGLTTKEIYKLGEHVYNQMESKNKEEMKQYVQSCGNHGQD